MALAVDFSVSEHLADDEDLAECPPADLISHWVEQASVLAEDRVVSVQIISAAEMQQLNRDWRGKDFATNVLSFPMQFAGELDAALFEGDEITAPPLGDIALCAVVINREASEQGKAKTAHWAHMVVHGTLHLQGYDHIDDKAADEMEALEIKILHTLGYDNPYLTTH